MSMNARTVVLPVLVLIVGLAVWWSSPTQPTGPSATWRVGGDVDFEQAANYGRVPAESRLRLSLSTDGPRHVYVLSHSREDGTLLLFPSPDLHSDVSNPLPAGRTVLPGAADDKQLAWTTRSQILATTCYVVVAAKQPIAELEQLIPHLRRWTNRALTDGSMHTTQPKDGELLGKPGQGWPLPLLERAAERAKQETVVNGPLHADDSMPDVWTGAVYLVEQDAAPAKPGETPAIPLPVVPVPGTPPPPGGK